MDERGFIQQVARISQKPALSLIVHFHELWLGIGMGDFDKDILERGLAAG